MLSLSTHQMNVFLTAAETLNFTQAAQRLQMTQPSVSQHIQALEEHFGLELFKRSGRNIELTDAGLALIPMARELVYLASHLEETMASLKGEIYGHLIVGCSTATGRYILPKLLARLHHDFPQVRATCHGASQSEALAMLAQGRIHVALATEPAPHPDIEFSRFATEKTVLIAPKGHPWSSREEIDVEDLSEEDFILPVDALDTYTALREELKCMDFSIHRLRPLMTLSSLEAIALAVQEGLGVGFVPELVIHRLVPGQVEIVTVRGLNIQRDIYIGRNTHRPATAAQDAFWDLVTTLDPATIMS